MALQRLHLRKSSKLQRKSEFERLKSAPFRRAGAFMAVSVIPGEGNFAKCGVICSRKFSLLAVERNRARRMMWESFRLLSRRILPCRMVLIPRRKIKSAGQIAVMQELENILAAANVLLPAQAESSVPSQQDS